MLFAFMTQSFVWADVSNTEAGSLAAPLSDDSINLVPERGEILEKSSSVQHHAEQSLSREEIVSAFMQTAFSSTVWMPNEAQKKEAGFLPSLFGHSAAKYWAGLIKKDAPWAVPFMGRMGRSLPDEEVIHKWGGEITIGFDWPPYGARCAAVLDGQYCLSRYTKVGSEAQWLNGDSLYPVLEDQIALLIPMLQQSTGRTVRFVSNASIDEKTASYARIRILWTGVGNQKNYFKRYYNPCGENCSVTAAGWLGKAEEYFWGAVPFTPTARAQVDGYILPENNNRIGLAVCKINRDIGPDLIKALVTECLARSLGLPGMLATSRAVLGRWNAAHEAHSKLVAVDGKSAVRTPGLRMPPFPTHLTKAEDLMLTFSEIDLKIISLLYCDDVKPGMSKREVEMVLMDETKCVLEWRR